METFMEGRDAYYDGTPNPYDEGTDDYDEFEAGLNEAWEDSKDEP